MRTIVGCDVVAWLTVKEAASAKTSRTDGRTLLANSQSLRRQMSQSNGPATAAAAADAADDETRKAEDDDAAVVATGFAVIADYADRQAPNDFFIPGRIFAVRVKHSDFPGQFRQLLFLFVYASVR